MRAEVDRDAIRQERKRCQGPGTKSEEQSQHEQHRIDSPEEGARLLDALADHGAASSAASVRRERGLSQRNNSMGCSVVPTADRSVYLPGESTP